MLSARISQKVAVWRCELLLEHWAEPLQALLSAAGLLTAPEEALLWNAWQELLQANAHDSLGGCVVEAVHREVDMRLLRCAQLGAQLAGEALLRLAEALHAPAVAAAEKLWEAGHFPEGSRALQP